MSVDDSGSGSNESPVPIAPPAAGVSCWYASLSIALDALPGHEALLSHAEIERANRFGTAALRGRFVVGRAMLRRVLGQVLAKPPADVALRQGPRGRPEIEDRPGIDFNVTHTRGIALIAVAEHFRVGIDIEHRDRKVDAERLARKFLTERERAALAPFDADERRRRFLRAWTCKEAMSKATGDGITAPFRQIDIELEGLRHVGGVPPYAPGAWQIHAVAAPGEYLATVALWQQ